MTRKDFRLIAEAVAVSRIKLMHAQNIFTRGDVIDLVAVELCRHLSSTNPAFDGAKFLKASGAKERP